MRIVMVGPFGMHPKQTMRSRALGLARPLVARGHTVRLIMPPWDTPAEAGRMWAEDGVELRYVPLRGGTLGITRRLIHETLDWQPDVVHCFKPKAYSGLVAEWLWRFHSRRIRLVMDSDDWEGVGGWNDVAPYTPLQKRFFARQERYGLTHAHAVTVASRTLQSLAWSLGVPHERVVYVPNGPGIPLDEVSPQERAAARARLGLGERPAVLVYSRLFEFDTTRLVDVLMGIRAVVPGVAVLLVGAGLYEADSARFREQLSAAGLLEAVVDAGWVELAQLPATLAAAGVGLYLMDDTLLNRTKCPVKLADMLAAGVPVVAEAVGQTPEYLRDGRTGALRETGDVAGLVAATVALLDDPAARARMGTAAAADIRARFSWERLAAIAAETYAG
ncbi:MAG: glycosyltransferase family 4 protein [Candidatus Promineofilum sp.]|nr:glycosyltransferase family 4 protein [Promineifilum sp.]